MVWSRWRSVWVGAVGALALAAACGDDSSADEHLQMLEVLEQHFVDRNEGDLDAVVAVHSDEATITLRATPWNSAWTGGVDEYVAWLAPFLGEGSGITWRLDETLFADNHVAFTFLEEKATGTSLRWLATIEFDLDSVTVVSIEGFVTGVAEA